MTFKFDSSAIVDLLLPCGRYDFVISNVEEKESKTGYLMLCFELTITDGKFEGKKLFENYLLNHPTVTEYAMISLRDLSEACQVPKWEDASELKGKHFSAEVAHRLDNLGITREKVKKFRPQDQKIDFTVMNINDVAF